MPPGTSPPETSKSSHDDDALSDASPSPGDARARNPGWWLPPNFNHLLIWWVVMIGYYVVFNTLSGRYHRGLIDAEMIFDGWYAILASAVIGALYAKRRRILWFLISMMIAIIVLLLMLLCLGALKALMAP